MFLEEHFGDFDELAINTVINTVSASIGGLHLLLSGKAGAEERLLEVVQKECGFEEGELRAIMVEAQPLLGNTLHWRVVDAKSGQIAEGWATLGELARRKPWDLGESPVAG